MKKLTLVISILFLFISNVKAQFDMYYIESISSCEFVELCLLPYDQEVSLYEWIIPGWNGVPFYTETDTLDNCIVINGLAPGTYEVLVYMYDWDGNLILHNNPDGTIQEFVVGDFFIFEGEPLQIFSNAMDFCPASPSLGCEKVCEFTTVTYTVEGFMGPVGSSYQWSVTGAESWVELSPFEIEVNWGEAGSGQVWVLSDDFNGCLSEAFQCVEVIDSPVSDFETNPAHQNRVLNICQGQEVSFDNTSTGAIYYEWSFGDGSQSVDANPEHSYNFPGTYEVQLISKNECLCADTSKLQVIVDPTISPFLDCVGTICKLDTITYTTDADCTEFNWAVSTNGNIISGGGPSDNFIAVDWQSGPVGNIELSVSNCNGSYCLVPAVVEIPIISGNAQIEGSENVCRGATEVYTIQDYNATYYNWAVSAGTIISGQGTNEVIVEWGNPGTLPGMAEISVDYENCYFECTGTDQLDVKIVDEFLGAGPIEVCPGATEDYTTVKISGTGKVTSNWSLKDEAGVEIWNAANAEDASINFPSLVGMYMLTIVPTIPDDYCNDFVEIIIKIVERPEAPTAIDGELAICPGSTYQYTASSNQSDASFKWYVNNGGAIQEIEGNPVTVEWAVTGPFEIGVTQTLYDRLPCESDQFTETITPISAVTLTGNDEVCDQEIHTYTAEFIENANYVWEISPADMGTITSEADKNQIDIQWNKVGTAELSVSLCGVQVAKDIIINALPEPSVSGPTELCANETGVYVVANTYTDYKWVNDNAQVVSNAASPSLFPGSYELVVTDDNGCTGNTYFTVEALPIPNIRISTPEATGVCLALGETFPKLYALDSDVGYSWQWYKDGVQIPGEVNATFDVSDYGLYQVEVTASNGCKNLSNSLSIFDWCDPTNGGTCTGGNCNLDYCDNPLGVLDFTFAQGGQCNEWHFTNTSVDFEPGSLEWNFGDEAVFNDVSVLENPSYVFSNAGFYHVLLKGRVLDANVPGDYCDIWRSKVITVEAAAKFDLDTGCPGEITKFYDNSTFIPGEDIISWNWDFGDPTSGALNTSSDQDPFHTYNDVGTYTVILEIATNNCVSRYTQQVTVYPRPVVTIPAPDVSCSNTAIEFVANTTGQVVDWVWNFGDPTSGDLNEAYVQTAFHIFETPGIYNVQLTAINIYGCEDVFDIQVEIEPNALNGDILSDNGNPMCVGDVAVLSAPANGIEWSWSTGEATETISIQLADVYSVTVTDIHGCTYTPDLYTQELYPLPVSAIRAVDVNEYGQALLYHYQSHTVCEGEDVYLEVIEQDNYTYQWSTGETSTQIEFSFERGNLLSTGTHDFTLVLTDETTGCTNTIGPFEVIVNPIPQNVTITSNPSGYLCGGENADLSVSNPVATYSYFWSNGAFGTSTQVSMAGEYFVIAVNEFGCQAESNTLTINQGPDIGLIPDGCFERCGPDTLCIPSIPNIASIQWYFNDAPVSGSAGMTEDFIITESGNYFVELSDVFGCTTTSEEFTVTIIDPVGTLNGLIYFDVNGNGIIDGPDTLMQNVQVYLENLVNTDIDSLITNVDGEVDWIDISSVAYQLSLDLTSLPSGVKPYDEFVDLELIGCDDQLDFSFLCYPACNINEVTVNEEFCSGTNIYDGISFDKDTSFVLNYTNVGGCDSIVTFNAKVFEEITFDLAAPTICFGANDGVVSVSNASGGKGNLFYSIDGINFMSALAFDNLPTDSYTIYVKDELECVVEKIIEIDEYPEITESVSVEYCHGAHSYNGISFDKDTSFVQILTSGTGCDSTLTVSAIVYDELVLDAEAVETCFNVDNGTLLINDMSGGKGTYAYSLNGIDYDVPLFSNLPPAIYDLEVTDELGCTTSMQLEVEEIAALDYSIDIPELACDELDETIALSIFSPDVIVQWNDGSTDEDLLVDAPGTYSVTLSNSCESITEEILVNAETLDNGGLFMPNIFSPNDDGMNDEFHVMMDPTANLSNGTITIMDRWGGIVYKSKDPTLPWRGTKGDNKLQPGVYVVMFSGTVEYCHVTQDHELHTEVTIVK